MFNLCAIYYTNNISIEEERQVFFRSMVNFPDNYRRYCGKSHLRYYDFSPFLLSETPGFLGSLEPLQGSALGPYSAPRDSQLARAMTFACRAHGMTSHEIFINRRGSAIFLLLHKQFNRVLHPVSTTASRELKNDNSLTCRSARTSISPIRFLHLMIGIHHG